MDKDIHRTFGYGEDDTGDEWEISTVPTESPESIPPASPTQSILSQTAEESLPGIHMNVVLREQNVNSSLTLVRIEMLSQLLELKLQSFMHDIQDAIGLTPGLPVVETIQANSVQNPNFAELETTSSVSTNNEDQPTNAESFAFKNNSQSTDSDRPDSSSVSFFSLSVDSSESDEVVEATAQVVLPPPAKSKNEEILKWLESTPEKDFDPNTFDIDLEHLD